jgi:hypothetical protein
MEMRLPNSRPLEPGDSSHGLRPLGWSELCARLVAAHDTRCVLAGTFAVAGVGPGRLPEPGAPGQQASFHSSAAALLRSVETQTETSVNPASSANGNGVQGNEGAAPNAATQRRSDENCHD